MKFRCTDRKKPTCALLKTPQTANCKLKALKAHFLNQLLTGNEALQSEQFLLFT